jgi:creatinine amidohydrolase
VVYVAEPFYSPEDEAAIRNQWETTVDGHAGEKETSAILAIRPDLVQRETIPTNGEGMPLGRLQHLRDLNIDVGVWWYADHPSHYCGAAVPASAEKGDFWLNARARGLAKSIRAIKDDTETKRLQDEFFARVGQP